MCGPNLGAQESYNPSGFTEKVRCPSQTVSRHLSIIAPVKRVTLSIPTVKCNLYLLKVQLPSCYLQNLFSRSKILLTRISGLSEFRRFSPAI